MDIHRVLVREEFGRPDIVFAVDGKAGSEWLLSYFNEQIRNGTRFVAEQTVQIGWALLRLEADDAGDLWVCEPDFSSMPVHWVKGASQVMRHMILQREVCDQLRVEPEFPSMVEPGVISPSFLTDRAAFSMSRDDAGWLLFAACDSPPQADLHSLYFAAINRTAIMPLLALPPETQIDWRPGYVEIVCGDIRASSATNAFLRQLVESSAFF